MKKNIFLERIKRVTKKIKQRNPSSCIALEAAPEKFRSGTSDSYTINPDFFYLTGSPILNTVLLISPLWKQPILITNKPNPIKVIWDGPQESAEILAENLNAELIYCEDFSFINIILGKIRNLEELYLPKQNNSHLDQVLYFIKSLDKMQSSPFPNAILSTEKLIAEERLIKDPTEVKLIQEAIEITRKSLSSLRTLIKPGVSESFLAAELSKQFKVNGATGQSFNTIMASGKNAAILHYHNNSDILKNDHYLLIDCGAEYQNYCADITRCYPVSETHQGIYSEIYQIVLSANQASIKAVKNGVSVKHVYLAAVKEITIGLKDLGILKGNTSKLIEQKAYAEYFMHSIGHSLGLETHDPGGHREKREMTLATGMVFTIEPGLYFSKKTKHIPAGGIRIEDDILVTKTGAVNLSNQIPK